MIITALAQFLPPLAGAEAGAARGRAFGVYLLAVLLSNALCYAVVSAI